jgi:hypothetical protein
MTDVARELRATSDALRRDLDALATLEDEKRTLPLDDPRVAELAHQIEEIAARVLGRTTTQKDLTEIAAANGTSTTIERVRRSVGDILNDWRDLERRAEEAQPESAEAAEVAVLLAAVREEYRAAIDTARERQ